jgi:nicotinamidase-related amidase
MTETDAAKQGQCPVALLLVDVINGFDFEDSEGLVRAADEAAPRILALAERARQARVPVVYVNDNFGQWRSDFRKTIHECSRPELPGHRVTQALVPRENDYFVLKPRHSAFYCTALELLLDSLGTRSLVVVGFAANICVLFTANDAHMRGYDVWIPSDCVASNSPELTRQALEHMRLVSAARVEPSTDIDFDTWSTGTRDASGKTNAEG